jgi:hypothetical protein
MHYPAFPKWQEGRHPHCHFRGLRRLHSRYGPPDCSTARGSSPAGYPAEPLVSYQINRQLSGWNLPPLVIRAFGAHCQQRTCPPHSFTSSASASGTGGAVMFGGNFSPRRMGWQSRRSFLRESYSGLRDGIDGCVRSRSSCYRWRTHHFKACFHKACSHHCPCQEDRREQAYDSEQTSVPWTLAGRLFILVVRVHDRHSLRSLFFNNLSFVH